MKSRRAVIDVGTNSVKLLVADIDDYQVEPVWEGSKQTRLGRGFYETRRLQEPAISQTARAVAEFAAAARERQAASIRVIATSAARDARNADELTAAIERATRLKMEILSGEQEADLVFQGVTTDPRLAIEPLLLLDVGGGSTEFILGQGGHPHFRESFPLGSVRLMEHLPHSDPPKPEELAGCREWVRQFLQREVQPRLEPAMRRQQADQSEPKTPAQPECRGIKSARSNSALLLVATGGTAAILARIEGELERYARTRIEAVRLSLPRVQSHVENLWRSPLQQRKQIIGLPASRADVILTGAVIYEAVMEQFALSELRVSTRGLRFAAVLHDCGTHAEA
jgi:exopolyphosphatase/guanosine-5'-triphosphate,3'-diphosphate pyrophosphatase